MSESKKIVHPRQRPCPDCGAEPGEPCVLDTGKILEDIHCTIRVTGYPVEGSWTPPQPGSLRDPLRRRDAAGQFPHPDPETTGVPNRVLNKNSAADPVTPPPATADETPVEPRRETPAKPAGTEPGPVGTATGGVPTELELS